VIIWVETSHLNEIGFVSRDVEREVKNRARSVGWIGYGMKWLEALGRVSAGHLALINNADGASALAVTPRAKRGIQYAAAHRFHR
jgi:hypothetical protein